MGSLDIQGLEQPSEEVVDGVKPRVDLSPPEEEQPPSDPPPSEPAQENQEAEQDYRALYEQSQARIAEAERQANLYRSQEISVLKQAERDAEIREMKSMLAALAEAAKSGELETYGSKYEEIQQQARSAAVKEEFSEEAKRVSDEARRIAQELSVDLQTHPQLENARLYWNTASRTGDPSYLSKADAELQRAHARIIAENSRKAVQDALKQGREEGRREVLSERERDDALDMSTGGGAGGSGLGSANAQVDAFIRGEIPKDQLSPEAKKQLGMR